MVICCYATVVLWLAVPSSFSFLDEVAINPVTGPFNGSLMLKDTACAMRISEEMAT